MPLPVIGTLTIIGLAYITRYLPFALRFVSTSMVQIHSELEESRRGDGGKLVAQFLSHFLPLLRPGLMAGWFGSWCTPIASLTISLMLARSSNRTASVIIFDLWSQRLVLAAERLGVILFALDYSGPIAQKNQRALWNSGRCKEKEMTRTKSKLQSESNSRRWH